MPLCKILLIALISSEKSIISGNNPSSCHELSFVCAFPENRIVQPTILSSYRDLGNTSVSCKNRCISRKIRFLTLILQGGIAFFAIFSAILRFMEKSHETGKESVTLPDLERSSHVSRIIAYLLKQSDVVPRSDP